MKRSEINKALKELEAMCAKYKCYLPPFCHFTPDEWKTKGHEYDEVRDCMLGWDITDFGLGNFDKFGFSLITIRNGCRTQPEKYPKVYAEKLLYLNVPRLCGRGRHRPRSARRGQPVQRRQHRQPLQPARRPFSENRGGRAALPPALQRVFLTGRRYKSRGSDDRHPERGFTDMTPDAQKSSGADQRRCFSVCIFGA